MVSLFDITTRIHSFILSWSYFNLVFQQGLNNKTPYLHKKKNSEEYRY